MYNLYNNRFLPGEFVTTNQSSIPRRVEICWDNAVSLRSTCGTREQGYCFLRNIGNFHSKGTPADIVLHMRSIGQFDRADDYEYSDMYFEEFFSVFVFDGYTTFLWNSISKKMASDLFLYDSSVDKDKQDSHKKSSALADKLNSFLIQEGRRKCLNK